MWRGDKIALGLQDLDAMDRAALAARWETLMKRPPPKAASRVFLLKALSLELQSKHAAGLSKADLKALSGSLRKTITIEPALIFECGKDDARVISHDAAAERQPPARVKLVPGARLVREWNGQTHTVSVIDEGFVYKNRTWSSLSAIAKDITGTHWSGPRFFGVDKAS